MVKTDEGIGSRKFSVNRLDGGRMLLMQGTVPLAVLTAEGAKIFALFVTAPQLWEAANQAILKNKTEALLARNETLANMVAKAVGKDDWSKVAQ